jgi:hypothetical protein
MASTKAHKRESAMTNVQTVRESAGGVLAYRAVSVPSLRR